MTPFPSTRRPASRRPARLALEHLEDRATPATAVYSPLTQTLFVTAGEGDRLTVAPVANKPVGYLTVTDTQHTATVFNSDAANQSVRNLVVKFGAAQSGGLTFNADARIGGSLKVSGATLTTIVNVLGSVGGNFLYTAAPTSGFDHVDVESSAQVAGNMTLNLGEGDNEVCLNGGLVRGNVLVTAGAGADHVHVTYSGDVTIGGSAAFRLGDGANTLLGEGLAHTVRVGANFVYTGGAGIDQFDLDGSGTALAAGGMVRVTLGTPTAFDANVAAFEALSAGRAMSFTGGLGSDTVTVSGALSVGGGLSVALGEGTNRFDTNLLGEGTNSIARNFRYLGGAGTDTVLLDVASVGRNANVTLGEGANQTLSVGGKGPTGVSIYGNLKVTGGSGVDNIGLQRLYVGGALTVQAGAGADAVLTDDIDVAGATRLNLGTGNDLFALETLAGLTRVSSFGGTFQVSAGAGDDAVNLSDDASTATCARFGSRVMLAGGTGMDTVRNEAQNAFEVTGNQSDFETKVGAAFI
ncbi:MAG TPA: hypothetical protein VKD90_09715 [Gemmataceae bacterium]|nr:hypothetical protein [Gemmataceae bacterium]